MIDAQESYPCKPWIHSLRFHNRGENAMKTCSISDFMRTIEPWLSEKYIRKVLISEKDRVELIFLDGVRQVYLIDDCSAGQIKKMVDLMKQEGIPVVIEK
jgi:hypothetical protein